MKGIEVRIGALVRGRSSALLSSVLQYVAPVGCLSSMLFGRLLSCLLPPLTRLLIVTCLLSHLHSLPHSPSCSYVALGSCESASLGHTLDVMGNQIHSLQATNTANAETESIYLEVRNVHTSSAACVLEVDLYILLFCPSNPSKGIR